MQEASDKSDHTSLLECVTAWIYTKFNDTKDNTEEGTIGSQALQMIAECPDNHKNANCKCQFFG